MDRKLEALFQHGSQISDLKQTKSMVDQWCSDMAQLGELGEGRFAEAYKFIQITH